MHVKLGLEDYFNLIQGVILDKEKGTAHAQQLSQHCYLKMCGWVRSILTQIGYYCYLTDVPYDNDGYINIIYKLLDVYIDRLRTTQDVISTTNLFIKSTNVTSMHFTDFFNQLTIQENTIIEEDRTIYDKQTIAMCYTVEPNKPIQRYFDLDDWQGSLESFMADLKLTATCEESSYSKFKSTSNALPMILWLTSTQKERANTEDIWTEVAYENTIYIVYPEHINTSIFSIPTSDNQMLTIMDDSARIYQFMDTMLQSKDSNLKHIQHMINLILAQPPNSVSTSAHNLLLSTLLPAPQCLQAEEFFNLLRLPTRKLSALLLDECNIYVAYKDYLDWLTYGKCLELGINCKQTIESYTKSNATYQEVYFSNFNLNLDSPLSILMCHTRKKRQNHVDESCWEVYDRYYEWYIVLP